MRETLLYRKSLREEKERWQEEIEEFKKEFKDIAAYPEK
jgi:hypothetical protein